MLVHLALCLLIGVPTRRAVIFGDIKKPHVPFSCNRELLCQGNNQWFSQIFLFLSLLLFSACSEPQAGEHFSRNPPCSYFFFRIRMLSLGWFTETYPSSYRGCLSLQLWLACNPHLFLLPSVCQVTSPQRHIWETQNPCLEWFSQASVQGEELGRQQSRGARNKCDSKEGVKKVPWGWNSMWEVSPVLGHRTLADAFIQAWVQLDLRCVVPCVIKWILRNAF